MSYYILVAEDETVTRNAIAENLRSILPDARLLLAENGLRAVEQARALPRLDIVFMDLKMPLMDGIEAARELRTQWENCQIIFLTAYSGFDSMREALALGAADYLLKPFSQTGLVAAVQKAAGRLKLLEQTREQLTRAQAERERLSELVDERTLLDVASGALDIDSEEALAGSAASGAFAVVRCPAGFSPQRASGLLRGAPWEARLRVLVRVRAEYIFLLVFSSLEEDVSAAVHERLGALCGKIRRLMHASLSAAVSDTFHSIHSAADACFRCYAALPAPGGSAAVRWLRENGAEAYAFGSPPAFRLDADGVETLFAYFALQRFSLPVCQRHLLARMEESIGSLTPQARALVTACEDLPSLAETARELCAALCQPLDAPQDAPEPPADGTEARIKDYLLAHYAEEITLEDISAALGYSRTYFSKLFKRLFGKNFVAYLTDLRIEEAKRLLKNGPFGIREVASRTGFRDGAYFSSTFRRLTGQTPSEYQESVRKKR